MKSGFFFLLVGFWLTLSAQTVEEFNQCQTKDCRLIKSYGLAKRYLEEDQIETAQKWLNRTKDLHIQKEKDSTDCFINSLQSELFYYMGMFQFGKTEAEKGLNIALKLNDSLLIADASFFVGINEVELKGYKNAEKKLWLSRNYFPEVMQQNRMTYTIEKEHIMNNLAQLKLKLNQIDSALFYNETAYRIAKQKHSKRAIPNSEQTFGQIYFQQGSTDSSRYYFRKSLDSSLRFKYFDLALVNYGFLMIAYQNEINKAEDFYENGKSLMQEQTINLFFQKMFYEFALMATKTKNQEKRTNEILNKIIEINSESRRNTNLQIQEITTQYIKNEKKLLSEEANRLRKQRNITVLLIISALLCICILVLSMMIVRRKNLEEKKQGMVRFESILNGQETERKRIAQDLHDGLNGDLSAIKFKISDLKERGVDPSEKESFQEVITMIDQACSQVRRISHDLVPASIEEFGLIESMNQFCKKLNLAHSTQIDFQAFGTYQPLPQNYESRLYRIIQELLNNITKHAEAQQALVQINFHEDELSISVEDDGKGFDPHSVHKGIGLKNIRSRMKLLQGELDIKSSETGTSVHILVDLKKLKK